jgi:phosphoglycolate phosphatase
MPRLSGLIFDLDGTLVDSAPDIRQALNAVMRQEGRRELTLEEVKNGTGDGFLPSLTRAFERTGGVPPKFDSYAVFQIFLDHYRRLKPDPAQIYPGGRAALEYFHDKGISLGLCTNKQEAATQTLLADLGIARYFSFVAGGDTFPVHKPHAGHVTGVMEKLGTDRKSCAMIGDSSNDVTAAHGAGIPCIAVTHGYSENFAGLGADRLISSFDELREALRGLGFELVP